MPAPTPDGPDISRWQIPNWPVVVTNPFRFFSVQIGNNSDARVTAGFGLDPKYEQFVHEVLTRTRWPLVHYYVPNRASVRDQARWVYDQVRRVNQSTELPDHQAVMYDCEYQAAIDMGPEQNWAIEREIEQLIQRPVPHYCNGYFPTGVKATAWARHPVFQDSDKWFAAYATEAEVFGSSGHASGVARIGAWQYTNGTTPAPIVTPGFSAGIDMNTIRDATRFWTWFAAPVPPPPPPPPPVPGSSRWVIEVTNCQVNQ